MQLYMYCLYINQFCLFLSSAYSVLYSRHTWRASQYTPSDRPQNICWWHWRTASLLSPGSLFFLAATAHCKHWQSHSLFSLCHCSTLKTQYSFHRSVLLSSVEEGWPKQDEKWVVGQSFSQDPIRDLKKFSSAVLLEDAALCSSLLKSIG